MRWRMILRPAHAGFKDCTGVIKELRGEDCEIHKVIKNTSTGQFIALASRMMRVFKVSANLRFAISPQHSLCLILIFFLAQKISGKSTTRITLQALISFTAMSSKWHLRARHGFHIWYWQTRHRTPNILKYAVFTVLAVLCSTSLTQHHQWFARNY